MLAIRGKSWNSFENVQIWLSSSVMYPLPEGGMNSKSADVLSLGYCFLSLQEKPSDSQVAVPSRVLTPHQAPAQTGDSSLAILPMAEAALKPHPEL